MLIWKILDQRIFAGDNDAVMGGSDAEWSAASREAVCPGAAACNAGKSDDHRFLLDRQNYRAGRFLTDHQVSGLSSSSRWPASQEPSGGLTILYCRRIASVVVGLPCGDLPPRESVQLREKTAPSRSGTNI